MKKIIDIPLIVEMSEWHTVTEFLNDIELKTRLIKALDKEFRQIDQERRCAEYAKELAEEYNKNLSENLTITDVKSEEDEAS